MRCKVYQVIKDKEERNFAKLRALEKFYQTLTVDPSIYQKVLDVEMEEEHVTDIGKRLHNDGHPLMCGDTFGISDVLVTEKGAYLLSAEGFRMVTFDETQVKQMEDSIRILYVEPMKKPYVAEISKDYRMQQQAVKGLIEYIYNDDKTIFVVNDEHKINGMQGNRRIQNDVIAGPFFVAGDTGEDLCSLTDEQVKYYELRFKEPENITRYEIESYLYRGLDFGQSM